MQIKAWLSGVLLAASGVAHCADDWWFDVEVIAFKRNVDVNSLQEKFALSQDFSSIDTTWDIFSQTLYPDIAWVKQNLGECDASPSPIFYDMPSLDDISAMYDSWRQSLTPEELAAHDEALVAQATDLDNDAQFDVLEPGIVDNTASSALVVNTDMPTSPLSVDGLAPQLWTPGDIADQWLHFFQPQRTDLATIFNQRLDCNTVSDWLVFDGAQWTTTFDDNTLPDLDKTPIVLRGKDWPRSSTPHVLSEKQHELSELSKQIRWKKGLERILHVAWRQEVKFGQDNADTVRLFAGTNFGDQFTLAGKPRIVEFLVDDVDALTADLDRDNQADIDTAVPQRTILDDIEDVSTQFQSIPLDVMLAKDDVDSSTPENEDEITPIWELDGGIKIFLKYINRVPYLHIDSQLAFRQATVVNDALIPVSEQDTASSYELVSVPFTQVRRVISKQVHYFDHPLFGFVIELRRYKRPAEEIEEPTVIQ